MANLVNLTPHPIRIVNENGEVQIPPSGQVARVASSQVVIGYVDHIPIRQTTFGQVENLPDPQPGTIYVVSSLVAQAVSGVRDDVVAPDTSPSGEVRAADGRIIAVTGFQRF